ncbi:PREDICTED: pre-mRNA-splicing factor SPP2-like isoform X3 [Acropora digitifera]|uniref:pre-mRNA-splicing factor SPP2-like isoform X3 n=1 Tax=Acropora digitifera TaxID=70779 RepID=UPI00077A53CA|nr:PREDICTED: pre-mRNA-splicing factor SPP2-like isoform X3 [Acropora digitifera]
MKGSLTFLVLALISYSLSSPIQSDKEELLESLFTEDQDTRFDDDRSPKETSDLAALEEILDTEDLPRKKVEKLSKVRHQGTLKEALYKDEARDESNALSKDVLADYERRPKEDESSNGEFAGIPINNDEATHKEQGHRRQDERRTSADYEERPKEDQSSHKEFSGISITNDETTRKEQNHPKDERRTSAAYEERPKEDEKSHKGFAGMRIGNDEPKRSHPKDERRKSADYEKRPKEDENSFGGEFAGIPINNDEVTLKEQGHRRQDERRTSAATLEKFVGDSSVSDLFEAPSGSGAETVDG